MAIRTLMRGLIAGQLMALYAVTVAFAQVTPPAVLNTSDPALRMWLDASTLSAAGLVDGDPINSWVDKSSYGTILAPRTTTNANGPFIGDPVEEHPHFQYVDIAGNSVPTVRFDRDGPPSQLGDPNVDGTGSTDRMYQTNNLAPNFDPLDIGDGSSLTTFVVFKPDVTTSLNNGNPILGYQVVYGKRGTSSSVYTLGIINYPGEGGFNFVSYDGPVSYRSIENPTEQVWHVTSQVLTDNPGATEVDTIQFFDADDMSPTQTLTDMGTKRPDGSANTLINGRNASTPEPFALGGHSQACCGEGETFAGNIAELIIFAKTLTPQEYNDVASYLSQKYFTPGGSSLAGDYDGDNDVDGADLAAWKVQFGQPLGAAPNADGDGDGVVDGADYLIWQRNFGASPTAAAVPEPASVALLACGLAALARGALRKRHAAFSGVEAAKLAR